VLDTFVCQNTAPRPGENGRVNLDLGFIPPEMGDGGDWFVDNTRGVHEGEAAIRAPALLGGAEATMRFDCGDQPHAQMSFYLLALAGETRQLRFYVDGELRETFVSDGAWRQQIIDVPQGTHEYTFTAATETDTSPPFVLDTFVCTTP
jgi:hypothetical protein